ncbi:hypothetical protein [Streptomyces sp. AC154]|uniref:hypothetical protein n=1 Tax=Streptomyces sp. AC154 TaxID=3143184 RepID=UPI003F8172D9
MSGHSTTADPPGTPEAAVSGPGRPVSGLRKLFGSLMWAVLLPALMVLGAALANWVMWAGVVVMLAVAAFAACLIGGVWSRAGAATLVCVSGFALMLFAGPALYDVYMKTAGDPVAAVVTDVTEDNDGEGSDWHCRVAEDGGDHEEHELSQQQNCFGGVKTGEHVEIRKDPLGLFEPRMPDGPGHSDAKISAEIAAGLLLLTSGTVFYGSRRRRP